MRPLRSDGKEHGKFSFLFRFGKRLVKNPGFLYNENIEKILTEFRLVPLPFAFLLFVMGCFSESPVECWRLLSEMGVGAWRNQFGAGEYVLNLNTTVLLPAVRKLPGKEKETGL